MFESSRYNQAYPIKPTVLNNQIGTSTVSHTPVYGTKLVMASQSNITHVPQSHQQTYPYTRNPPQFFHDNPHHLNQRSCRYAETSRLSQTDQIVNIESQPVQQYIHPTHTYTPPAEQNVTVTSPAMNPLNNYVMSTIQPWTKQHHHQQSVVPHQQYQQSEMMQKQPHQPVVTVQQPEQQQSVMHHQPITHVHGHCSMNTQQQHPSSTMHAQHQQSTKLASQYPHHTAMIQQMIHQNDQWKRQQYTNQKSNSSQQVQSTIFVPNVVFYQKMHNYFRFLPLLSLLSH